MTQLPDVPEPLERGRIDDRRGQRLQGDVVPEDVANDDLAAQIFGPALLTASGTPAEYFSKFFVNSSARCFAAAS